MGCCGNSAEAGATRRFLSQKVHVLASKNSTYADFGKETIREYFRFLPLDEFLVLLHPCHNRKQQNLRVLVRIDARLWPVWFCPFENGQVIDVRNKCCF